MSERLQQFLWAFSTKKQTAYATPLADVDLTITHALLGAGDVEEIPTVITDAEEAGRNTEWPGLTAVERWDAQLKRETWGTPEILGWLGAYWFGSVATTGAGPFTHTFSVLRPPTTALPVTTIVELGASALRRKIESVVVQSIELSAEAPGRLKVSAALIGSGKITLPGSFTFPAMPAEAKVNFRTNNLVFTLNGVDVSARLLSFSHTIENALLTDAGYTPNSGLYRSTIEYGERRGLTFECSLLLDTAGAELVQLRAGTVLATNTLVFTTGTKTFTVSAPKMVIVKAPIADQDGRRVVTLTMEILDDLAAASPLRWIVVNDRAAYLN